ncbi:MAG: SoxR reducing system RseC family protein [Gammaproteobacteria bacterium]|nr:SoxR reducing system RseC family protein [Gammaproteobacteria bacterium]
MIEEVVRVVSRDGQRALVEACRMTACGRCESSGSCGASVLAGWFSRKPFRATVLNPIGADPGDRVVIGLDEAEFTGAAVALYLVPLLSLIGLAIGGHALGSVLGFEATEPWSVSGGLLGLVTGLFGVKYRNSATSERVLPKVVILRQASNPVAEISPNQDLS